MYIKRSCQPIITQHLFKGQVIIIYGPRQAGKTTLVKKIVSGQTKHYRFLNCDEADIRSLLEKADTSARLLQIVGKEKITVIDEAQRIENIGLKLKLLVDNFPEKQIIATGSSSFELANKITEPLTGRNYQFWLHPFSLEELSQTMDNISLNRQLESLLIFGSYPKIITSDSIWDKNELLKLLTNDYLYKDIVKFGRSKSQQITQRLLQALALQIGSQASLNELANLLGIAKQTVAEYLDILEKTFVIFRLPAFSRNRRKEISKSQKIYFWDLGIRNAVINNLNSLDLRQDVGQLWENFVIAEFKKQQFYPPLQKNLFFWRTYNQEEIDLIIEDGGRIQAVEIKWRQPRKQPPKSWRVSYPQSSWQSVTPQNFQGLLLAKKNS